MEKEKEKEKTEGAKGCCGRGCEDCRGKEECAKDGACAQRGGLRLKVRRLLGRLLRWL